MPHILIDRPWPGERLQVSPEQRDHLERVLRMADDEPISYTDGMGLLGKGTYRSGWVSRGEESSIPSPSDLVLVVAPPSSRDRLRFLVEKLAELGVSRLRFLDSVYGQGRIPSGDKMRAWAVSAMEQSRGSWLMRLDERSTTLADLERPFAVCDPSGGPEIPTVPTVVVGPEGGWAPDEIPDDALRLSLGATILRVETAAIVAASRMI
ncbi:MAG: RsmE family RNA methyltransferase [Acidimicrobiia bacterium]